MQYFAALILDELTGCVVIDEQGSTAIWKLGLTVLSMVFVQKRRTPCVSWENSEEITPKVCGTPLAPPFVSLIRSLNPERPLKTCSTTTKMKRNGRR